MDIKGEGQILLIEAIWKQGKYNLNIFGYMVLNAYILHKVEYNFKWTYFEITSSTLIIDNI